MKQRLSILAPLALSAVLVIALVPVVGADAPTASGSAIAVDGPVTSPATGATCAATFDRQPIVSARPTCEEAACNQSCIDQGGAFGFCRGNLCVCGI
ncbi:MAG: hypothetical protein PVG07_12365 [Acidobacteriota bacterium]